MRTVTTTASGRARRSAGRPEATSHADIEQAAFRLFAERGFDDTTLDAIAAAVGVSRRTLFRYYASKNDIPWGQFDRTLEHFRALLRDQPRDLALWEAIHRAVRAFNDFPADASPPHVERMRLILHTPTLQSHSVLRYGDWRREIEEFVVERLGHPHGDSLAALVGHVSLALAHSAYESWLSDPAASLPDLIDDQMALLRHYLSTSSS